MAATAAAFRRDFQTPPASTAASTSAADVYQRAPRGRRSGWSTDYPDADINFSIRLSELTKTRVSRQPDGEPNHLTSRSPIRALFQCPFLSIDRRRHGAVQRCRGDGAARLPAKGGFLWVGRFLGRTRGTTGSSEIGTRAAAGEYPDHGPRRRASDLSHAVRGRRGCRRFPRSSSGGAAAARPPSAARTAPCRTSAASATRTAG